MNVIRTSIISVLTSLFLSGCATNVIQEFAQETGYDQLYLRGVFSWWEADDKYQLKEVSSQVYATQIELIADGQPYDFKFADVNWTPGLNCGYANKSNRKVEVGNLYRADCESTDNNFVFTPTETGLFQFSIDFSGFGQPKIRVQRIN